jgi:5-methylcytosine-specific restriction endonuclease McrA
MPKWKAPPGWKKTRARVFAAKGRSCHWGCGRYANTVDHLVPIALGGSHDLSNLVPACGTCNYRRGASLGGRILSARRNGQPIQPWRHARRW